MQESGEMYLETILVLSKEKSKVRATDIAENMGFKKPSISKALSKLKADSCIETGADGAITLTEKGREIALKIYERHIVLSEILQSLGVSRETALSDACKIEHDLSDETFNAIKKYQKTKENQ